MDGVCKLLLFICVYAFLKVMVVPVSTLYNSSENITILDADNIYTQLFESSSLWLVEYYVDWCQQCQDFAPVYKALARDIAAWNWMVKLGAIDCGGTASGGEENYLTCHQYPFWITDYPVLKAYHGLNVSEGGIDFNPDVLDVRSMRKEIVNLIDDSLIRLPWSYDTTKPDFTPLNSTSAFDANSIKSVKSKDEDYLVLVFESNQSTMGKEIIMDMSSCRNVVVRRVVVGDTAPNVLPPYRNDTETLPFVVVSCSNGSVIPIHVAMKTRYFYVYQLKRLSGVGPARAHPIVSRSSGHMTTSQYVAKSDRVYQADISSGVRYMLTVEASAYKTLTGAKLKALQKIVALLASVGNHFPGRPSTVEFFRDLDEWIQSRATISSDDWLRKVREKKANRYLPTATKKWVECQSTGNHHRGYPCSLWLLFHALSIAAYKANVDKSLLPSAFQSYVLEFFGCRECRNNFRKELLRTPYEEAAGDNGAILWLWKIHNKINERLAAKASSSSRLSSAHAQFPPSGLCSLCRDAADQWVEDEVVRFLIGRFSLENISLEYLDTDDGSEAEQEYSNGKRKWIFKQDDWNGRHRFHPRALARNIERNKAGNRLQIFPIESTENFHFAIVLCLSSALIILYIALSLRRKRSSTIKISKKMKHIQ